MTIGHKTCIQFIRAAISSRSLYLILMCIVICIDTSFQSRYLGYTLYSAVIRNRCAFYMYTSSGLMYGIVAMDDNLGAVSGALTASVSGLYGQKTSTSVSISGNAADP